MAFARSFLATFACALSLLAGAGADKAFLGASAPQTGVVERPTALVEASSAVDADSKDEPKDEPKKEPKQDQPQQKEEEEEEGKEEKEQEQGQTQEQEQEGEEEQGEHGSGEEEEKETGTAPSESEDCSGKGGNPMLQTVLSMAPQCFHTCPKMCSVISKVLGQFSAVPDRSVIKDQVCKYKEVFSCALENVDACKAVLTPAAGFGVPQDNEDLSRQCGTVAKDMKPKDAKDATSSAAQLGGVTVMAASLLLASTLQHLA